MAATHLALVEEGVGDSFEDGGRVLAEGDVEGGVQLGLLGTVGPCAQEGVVAERRGEGELDGVLLLVPANTVVTKPAPSLTQALSPSRSSSAREV